MKRVVILVVSLCLSISIQAQKLISGVVSDSSGPLPGVSVLVKGTTVGTETDFDGNYSILANKGDVLQFSYVGMQTEYITVKDMAVINVIMQPDNNSVLDEVVVTGIGRKGKIRLRGLFSKKESCNNISYTTSYSDESYKGITENIFKSVNNNPLSTFSIDVDKASYSNVRRMINNGETIPKDAVKIEEMINYFHYDYPQPKGEDPFAIHTEVGECPWNKQHELVKIGLQGKMIPTDDLPASNLVFLIDVSGSMDAPNKLPLLKSSFKLLVNQLREQDKVSIVVYAGAAGVVLKPTSGENKNKILEALDNLEAGGSTAGGAGIKLAYKLAEDNYKREGNNRVILATDGDFNVGASSDKAMEKLIEEKRKSGVFLTVLGFGMGNYKDSKLETLADKGNGNHAYIDTMQEAQRVLGQEFGGTLFTIAKDVKIQVEFNPKKVQAYRLIGYENRLLQDEDFTNDTIDAGEIGSGHTVTALYEIIPVGVKSKFTKHLPKLKYTEVHTNEKYSDELLTIKFRYKKPKSNTSKEIVRIVHETPENNLSDDFKFASSVAMFGMQLRDSEFKADTNYDKIIALAKASKTNDKDGYKAEFVRLVKAIR